MSDSALALQSLRYSTQHSPSMILLRYSTPTLLPFKISAFRSRKFCFGNVIQFIICILLIPCCYLYRELPLVQTEPIIVIFILRLKDGLILRLKILYRHSILMSQTIH